MLAGVFGAELNVKRIVVPYTASVNCAFGLVSADIVHAYSTSTVLPAATPAEKINSIYEPMMAKASKQLADEGFTGDKVRFEWLVDLRYSRQVHEVTTPVRAKTPLNSAGVQQLIADFEALYEKKYGKGSAYREAGVEMTLFRLTARGLLERPKLEAAPLSRPDPSRARVGKRMVFVETHNGMAEADIYDFERLVPGNVIEGPAVIHTPITTIVVQAEQRGTLDGYRNVLIDFH
jgi:N-methylhydantoinase A